ncbi:MAG: hypothetical protein RMK40_06505 [Chloroflexota bacterium]|nr:hypothetical protein [Chloroflexota bacterium]
MSLECAFHPGVETALRCGRCERPICPRCVVHTPVGARCRQCAQVRRLPTYTLTPAYALRGVLAGVGMGVTVGLGISGLLRLVPMPFMLIGWLVPLYFIGAGFAVGEAVSLATNRKRGAWLQGIALLGFLIAFLVPALLVPSFMLWRDLFSLAGLIVGIALAIARVR